MLDRCAVENLSNNKNETFDIALIFFSIFGNISETFDEINFKNGSTKSSVTE